VTLPDGRIRRAERTFTAAGPAPAVWEVEVAAPTMETGK
jgi:hypothetical protein